MLCYGIHNKVHNLIKKILINKGHTLLSIRRSYNIYIYIYIRSEIQLTAVVGIRGVFAQDGS